MQVSAAERATADLCLQPDPSRVHNPRDLALLMRVLDEVDYGLIVIDSQGLIRHANHLARHEMTTGRLIASRARTLLGSNSDLSVQIQAALEQALRGQRRLVLLKSGSHELSLACVPLCHPLEFDEPTVLVLLSRQNASKNLALGMFARSHHLSPSEEAVLLALCRGLTIPEIARGHCVAESTVRSQIKALREKTGCSSIRGMMQRVHSLPPVMPALRVLAPLHHNAMDFTQP